jgi:hypothetical protein
VQQDRTVLAAAWLAAAQNLLSSGLSAPSGQLRNQDSWQQAENLSCSSKISEEIPYKDKVSVLCHVPWALRPRSHPGQIPKGQHEAKAIGGDVHGGQDGRFMPQRIQDVSKLHAAAHSG